MATRTIDDVKLDIDDLEGLLPQAKRQKIKDLLSLEVRKLQTELSKLQESKLQESKPTDVTTKPSATSTSKCYTVKLTNYAWDESNNFMKLYIALKNVHQLPAENVRCDFDTSSMHLKVSSLENKNYELPISNLCDAINPAKSYTKVKTDMIVVFLAKKSAKTWSHVTGIEKRMQEAKATPDLGANSDPESSLMNLMKKMYQDGDDDMKRTIAKAWTEKNETRGSPGGDFPGL